VHFVESLEDVNKLNLDVTSKYSIVAQTTFNYQLYEEILNKLQKKSIHVIINETICAATMERQIEANELSKKVTKMIVIGGRNSSNTRKLYEICKSQCKDSYYIETIEDLVLNVFAVNDIIGITAGASTPKNIIKEVISNVRNVEF
jgi:4-hydroxy-3-methylbut-2-enyl diphosphate reductase